MVNRLILFFSVLHIKLTQIDVNMICFQVKHENCQAALSPDMLATDLAYYLVRKGVGRNKS